MSRWLAGSLFLLLQYIVLAIALSLIAGGSAFSGNLIAVISGGVLLCLFLSLVMMLTGLLSKTAAFAVRAAFLCVLALALLGGLLVPSAYMPAIVRDVSYVTPFSAALRLNIAALFNGKAEGLYLFAGILAAYTAVLLPMVLRRFQRKTQ
jgi:ABC-type uncharacterized transport system permease subunit